MKINFTALAFLGLVAAPAFAQQAAIINQHVDASGRIKIAVFERQSGSPQAHFTNFSVEVPEDYIVIGGGGEGARLPAGNLLTASYPSDDLGAWIVSSKDHSVSNPVKLKAWAIGLKIEGLTRDQLLQYINVDVRSSGYEAHPDTSAFAAPNHVLIGGGFRVDWSGAGNIGTASYPYNSLTWRVKSKDHSVASPAAAFAYAISIAEYIPGVGSIYANIQNAKSTSAQHPASASNILPGYALASCGAFVDWAGAGNLLWKIKPVTLGNQRGCEAASKDHSVVSPATITSYAIGIQAI